MKGYHEETHWRTRSSRDNDGNWVEEREVSYSQGINPIILTSVQSQ